MPQFSTVQRALILGVFLLMIFVLPKLLPGAAKGGTQPGATGEPVDDEELTATRRPRRKADIFLDGDEEDAATSSPKKGKRRRWTQAPAPTRPLKDRYGRYISYPPTLSPTIIKGTIPPHFRKGANKVKIDAALMEGGGGGDLEQAQHQLHHDGKVRRKAEGDHAELKEEDLHDEANDERRKRRPIDDGSPPDETMPPAEAQDDAEKPAERRSAYGGYKVGDLAKRSTTYQEEAQAMLGFLTARSARNSRAVAGAAVIKLGGPTVLHRELPSPLPVDGGAFKKRDKVSSIQDGISRPPAMDLMVGRSKAALSVSPLLFQAPDSLFDNYPLEGDESYPTQFRTPPLYNAGNDQQEEDHQQQQRKSSAKKGGTLAMFYMCPRDWVADFLQATIIPRQKKIPVRYKMGEVRQWTAILRSLLDLGCPVTISNRCSNMEPFMLNQLPAMSSSDDGEEGGEGGRSSKNSTTKFPLSAASRFLVMEDLGRAYLTANRYCKVFKAKTVIASWEKSPMVEWKRTVSAFKPIGSRSRDMLSVGIDATCPYHEGGILNKAHNFTRSWFGFLWGKRHQIGPKVEPYVEKITKMIPLVSVCKEACQLPTTHNFRTLSKTQYDELLARSLFVLGIRAPVSGATVPEALACGTPVIARIWAVPEEFRSHPLVYIVQDRRTILATVKKVLEKHYGYDVTRGPLDQAQQGEAPGGAGGGDDGAAPLPISFNPPPKDGSFYHPDPDKVDMSLAGPPYLPDRYSLDGHRRHIAKLFGLDDHCRVVNEEGSPINRQLKQPWEAGCR